MKKLKNVYSADFAYPKTSGLSVLPCSAEAATRRRGAVKIAAALNRRERKEETQRTQRRKRNEK